MLAAQLPLVAGEGSPSSVALQPGGRVVSRQGWLTGPTFPSRGPRLTILSQVPTPARSPHVVPAIKGITAHCRNAVTPGGLAGTSRGSVSVTMTVGAGAPEGSC